MSRRNYYDGDTLMHGPSKLPICCDSMHHALNMEWVQWGHNERDVGCFIATWVEADFMAIQYCPFCATKIETDRA